jgi:hypothetical protein
VDAVEAVGSALIFCPGSEKERNFLPPGAFPSNFVTHPSFFGKGGSHSGELNNYFFFGNIKLDSSGAVGLKISDVPSGTLETKLLFQKQIEWGVGAKTWN